MSQAPSAAELLRSIGLDVDGPARWGSKPTSRAAGIFAIETPTPGPSGAIEIDEVRRWLERVPELKLDGARPTQTTLAARLRSFWIPDQALLYVGRTNKSLSARVSSLYATELGHARPHPGGHWLKTLREVGKLRLWWAETDAPEEYEDALIAAFAASVPEDLRAGLPDGAPVLPWANVESPTGPARDTGISGELLTIDPPAAKAGTVKRSSKAGITRRKATTSGTPRAPRKTATKPGAGNAAAATGAGPKKDQPTHVTAEGLATMEADLKRLTTVERPQVVERVKNARELGDLRENADYEAARNEQSFLEGQVLELEQRLRTAVVIGTVTGETISMGSTVHFEIEGEEGELTIVGSTESDPSAGKISAVSPVGRALIGHRQGDDVMVATPAAKIQYHIVKID